MARILIVDDDPLNRELLHVHFDGDGHEIIDAPSGEQGLLLAAEIHPDIVLLDVMMGGLNGFETAARLKKMADTEFLPVILLTALGDQQSRSLGLRMGADEVLTKPVDRQELSARVNNLLALRAKNTEIAKLSRFKDEMSALIVHDLKNPMSVILANCEYLEECLTNPEPDHLEALRDCQQASRRIMRLLANLLDLVRLEERRFVLRPSPTPLVKLLSNIAAERKRGAANQRITMAVSASGEKVIQADADLVTRVVENVLDNALRYTPPGGRIEISLIESHSTVDIRVGNSGRAIPLASRAGVFDKFVQDNVAHGRLNMGLGLYFCRLAAQAHRGKIWIEETPELPTVFVIELPIHQPDSEGQ